MHRALCIQINWNWKRYGEKQTFVYKIAFNDSIRVQKNFPVRQIIIHAGIIVTPQFRWYLTAFFLGFMTIICTFTQWMHPANNTALQTTSLLCFFQFVMKFYKWYASSRKRSSQSPQLPRFWHSVVVRLQWAFNSIDIINTELNACMCLHCFILNECKNEEKNCTKMQNVIKWFVAYETFNWWTRVHCSHQSNVLM